ncbi:MAG TPA: linear amide C-N hydrolase [Thermoanaerobaculia bacterium]
MRAIVAILMLAAATAADACTTFCTRGLFGRNYDFEIGYGLVMVNKRDVRKTSQKEVRPAAWTSRYGSLTFNQFGRDSATGGMNEKGLVVELMWLDGTRYPEADARSELGTLEWIQYQLDTASTVAEVIASDAKVRIGQGAPLHYLVADAAGDKAAIEFLDGKMVVHRDANVLANDPYSESVAAAKRGARDRFARASQGMPAATNVDAAFALLDEVAQPHTQWSIVYDIRNRAVHWRTARNRAKRSVKLASFDFSCATPVQIADVDSDRFTSYTREQNAALVRRSVRGTSFLKNTPDAEIEESARWPERSACTAPALVR